MAANRHRGESLLGEWENCFSRRTRSNSAISFREVNKIKSDGKSEDAAGGNTDTSRPLVICSSVVAPVSAVLHDGFPLPAVAKK